VSVRSSWSAPYPCSNPSGLRPGRRPAGTSRAPGRPLTLRSCRRVSRFAAIRSLFASAPCRCRCSRSSLRSGTQTRYAAFVHLHQDASRLAEDTFGVHAPLLLHRCPATGRSRQHGQRSIRACLQLWYRLAADDLESLPAPRGLIPGHITGDYFFLRASPTIL
jgi:hypothetical protein